MSRLTKDQILSIYNDAEGTYKEIGKRHGVSASCVTHIKTGFRHASVTNATDTSNGRKKIKPIDKAKAQAVFDYMNDPDQSHTKEEASEYFGIPVYTIRRIQNLYFRKYKIKQTSND